MGHCDIDSMQDGNAKIAEKAIDTKPKEKVKNNTYDKIKHIVLGNGNEKMKVSPQPQKNKINIGL